MSECSLSGRGQGHVSNFYIVDLENFATASRRYTGDVHNSNVVGLFDIWDNGSRLGRIMVECTLFATHCLRLNLQLHTISLVRTCRISSFCTVAWQLARLLLTRRIARSLGDSGASCSFCTLMLFSWQTGYFACKNHLTAAKFLVLPLQELASAKVTAEHLSGKKLTVVVILSDSSVSSSGSFLITVCSWHLYVQQRNLKEKFVALLRRFKVSDEVSYWVSLPVLLCVTLN